MIDVNSTQRGQVWAIVLSAGEGTRLGSLTPDVRGNSVPKQFCSRKGRALLVEKALARACSVTSQERQSMGAKSHDQRRDGTDAAGSWMDRGAN